MAPQVVTWASANATAAKPEGGREKPIVAGNATTVAEPSLLKLPAGVRAAGTSDTPRVAAGSIRISLPIGTLMIAPGMVSVRLSKAMPTKPLAGACALNRPAVSQMLPGP